MIATTVLLLVLGILLGSNVLAALLLMPAAFRLLPERSVHAFVTRVISPYYLYCAALSGAALALLFSQLAVPNVMRMVIALCCVGYVLAWRELLPRLMQYRERGDEPALRRLERAGQILNTAQMAVVSAVFIALLRAL